MWTLNRRSHASRTARSHQVGVAVALLACVGLAACTAAETPFRLRPRTSATVSPPPETGELDPGTYLVTGFTVPFEITVPVGWESGAWFLFRDVSEEAGVAVNFQVSGYVPTDACAWKGAIVEVDPSLRPSPLRWRHRRQRLPRPAVEIMVGGFPGLEFDHSVESDVDINDCDEQKICLHSDSANNCARWHSSVNSHETYRVVDLNGERVVIAVLGVGSVDPAVTEEARAVFDSIEFALTSERAKASRHVDNPTNRWSSALIEEARAIFDSISSSDPTSDGRPGPRRRR